MAHELVTQQLADRICQLLRLDGEVEDYEQRDGAHWYHLENGTHLKIGTLGKSYGQYPGSAILVDDEGRILAGVTYQEVAPGVVRYWLRARHVGKVDFNTGTVTEGDQT